MNKLNVVHVKIKNKPIQSGCKTSNVTKKLAVIKIIEPIKKDFVAAAPTYPIIISKEDTGAESTSLIVPVNLGKYIPKAALEMLWVKTFNIINPGTIKAPYEILSIFSILEPIAVPKTTKYSAVEITGDITLWSIVLYVLFISKL